MKKTTLFNRVTGTCQVIHPVLLALYSVLFVYAHNIGQIEFQEVLKPLVITLGLTLFGWFILQFWLKDRHRSGCLVSLFLILFFSYGRVRMYASGSMAGMVLSGLWILIFLAGFYGIVRTRRSFVKITSILNLISGVLILFPGIRIVGHSISKPADMDTYSISTLDNQKPDAFPASASGEKQAISPIAPVAIKPDIYFIILDAYARADILQQMYHLDNSEFLEFLRQKGFYVADHSSTNYCQTGLTLSSCLNISYLDALAQRIGVKQKERKPLRYVIEKSSVVAFFKKEEYTTIAFESGCPEANWDHADIFLNIGKPIDAFQNTLKNITPLPEFFAGKDNDPIEAYRRKILYIFHMLGEVPKFPESPKFVFAHIESPHPPFVFGPNGEPVQLEDRFSDHDGDWLIKPGRLTREEYQSHYRDQLLFVNQKAREMVDHIIRDSKTPPIVILLGDHGPRSEVFWEDPQASNMQECLTSLLAVHLPEDGAKHLYSGITPVNIFRVILHHFFDFPLKLLPDRNYYSTADYPYRFYDVTERVQTENQEKP